MLIIIPQTTKGIHTVVKNVLTEPLSPNDKTLTLLIDRSDYDTTSPREEVLLSKPFIEALKKYLPKGINQLVIEGAHFNPWINEPNPLFTTWSIQCDHDPRTVLPVFENHLLYFFQKLPNQITKPVNDSKFIYIQHHRSFRTKGIIINTGYIRASSQ